MDEETKTKLKFKYVLDELLKDDYKVTDDTVFEKLLTHLSDKNHGNQIIDVPLCSEWVKSVLHSWNHGKISAAVVSFAFRLLSIVVEDESHFLSIENAMESSHNSEPFTGSLFSNLLQNECLTTFQTSSNFSLKCSLIQLLSALLKHSNGRQWIMKTGLWKAVHTLSLGDSSVYVAREARRFITNLLIGEPGGLESEVGTIFATVLEPFVALSSSEVLSENSDVIASLQLVKEILENIHQTSHAVTHEIPSHLVTTIYEQSLGLLPTFLQTIRTCKSGALEELLSEICILIYILTLVKDGSLPVHAVRKGTCIQILDVFNDLINKESVENVLKLCVTCHTNWMHVAKLRGPKVTDADQYRFEDQLLCLQLTPLCIGCTIGDSTPENYYQIQITKRLEINFMRSIYSFRDSLIKHKHFIDRAALKSVGTIYSFIEKDCDPETQRERAVLVFQSFIYVLKHFVLCAESETKGGWGGEFRQSNHSTLLVAILDGLANLVRSHKISWRESVESLSLLTLAQELLDHPAFSIKVGPVVQALQLIQLCIENFMPPNLALLTNSMSGTSLDKLGPLIYKRLHDPQWEVRDSSLEVLHTLATISHTKYPLFQDLILENKLCEVVIHLAVNDAESYVCASATKCLTAMVRVDRLWNSELCDKDVVNKMIGILNGESEGVLRREASVLMSQIFKHRKVPPDVFQKMCVTMANVVLSDLHWEVKVNALDFWEIVIEHQMNDQGMIDGEFPQVTFSKEHKKIINLTPAFIQQRLRKVMGELSQYGCLHVLLEVIQKDEDLQVVKRASHIISYLSKVLKKYDLLDPMKFEPSVAPLAEVMPTNSNNTEPYKSGRGSKSENNIFYSEEKSGENQMQFDSGVFQTSNSGEQPAKSILDLDPQLLGFAALSDDGDFPSSLRDDIQDKVIDSILNDRDINLLAKVYMGSGAEAPGRQGPETKIIRPVKPLVIMSSDDFLRQLSVLEIDKIVDERSRWIEDTGSNIDTLLDDMLIARNINFEDDDCNAMDCY